MFIKNKYTKLYYAIIEKYKNNNQDLGYREKHHILPKSLGGTNSKSNIVNLPIKAHYVCHHLLIYMTNGHNRSKMVYAFWRMMNCNSQKQKITAKIFERIRNEFIIVLKQNKNLIWIGRKHNESSKKLMREKAKGRNPHNYYDSSKYTPWNKGMSSINNVIIKSIADRKKGINNAMYNKKGKLHPNAKEFALYNNKHEIVNSFYTRKEFKEYCIINDIPFNGIYKTLKENIPFIDDSKNGMFSSFNGYFLKFK